jgi:Predicted transcription regulator containing HTH domain
MVENREVMGRNIQHYMEEKGVIAADVCRELGFKPNTFSDWCHGKTYPRIDAIEKMANYFGISKIFLVEDIKPLDFYHSPEEKFLIERYRKADSTTKEMLKRLLAYGGNVNDNQEKTGS